MAMNSNDLLGGNPNGLCFPYETDAERDQILQLWRNEGLVAYVKGNAVMVEGATAEDSALLSITGCLASMVMAMEDAHSSAPPSRQQRRRLEREQAKRA